MLHIIVNPSSSGGQSARIWKEIKPIITAGGCTFKIHLSTPDHGIEQICEEITSDGSENTLFILGGDGSMNEAVNGIRDFEKTRVGFLQVGSGNDLSRDMDLPGEHLRIVEAVLRNEVKRRCDVGEVIFHDRSSCLPGTEGERYARRLFNVGCGIGFDAECCEAAAASRFKAVLNAMRMGKLIYIASALRLIFTSSTANCEITFEEGDENTSRPVGTKLSYKNLLFASFMNHQYQGGGFQFCPHASADDARLDLCTASNIKRPQFFRIFPTAYAGGHLRYPGITEERSGAFTFRANKPLWVQTDGEVFCQSSHITVRLLPGKLQLVI